MWKFKPKKLHVNGSIRCQWHTNCHRSFMITCNLHGPRLLSLCLVKPWATAIVVRKTLQLRILCSSFPYLTEREKFSAQAREIEGKWSEWIKKKRSKSLYQKGWICEKPSFTPTDLQHFIHVYARQHFLYTHMNNNKRKSTISCSSCTNFCAWGSHICWGPQNRKKWNILHRKRFTKIRQVNKKIHFH